MTKTASLWAAAALMLCLAAPGADARAVAARDFGSGKIAIGTIALLPPQAEMLKRKVGADDSMIDESAGLEQAAVQHAVAMLEEKGYRVLTLQPSDIAADGQLQELVRQANARLGEIHAKVARRPGQIRKGRYSAGEEAQKLADYLNVDALAYERIIMEVAAPGQMAMALLVGGSSGGSKLDFMLINGEDGNVLAFYDAALGLIGEERAEENSENMVRKMSKRTIGKMPECIVDAAALDARDDDTSDMNELEELESLLGEGEGEED